MSDASPRVDQQSSSMNSTSPNPHLAGAFNLAETSNTLAKMLYEDQKKGKGERFDEIFTQLKSSLESLVVFLNATGAGVSSGLQRSGLLETASSPPASVKQAIQSELNNVLAEVDALKLPEQLADRVKQSARLAAEQLSKKEAIEPDSINSGIKNRCLNLLAEECPQGETKQWLDKIEAALPDENLTAARQVASKIQAIRAEGFFKLLSLAHAPAPVSQAETSAVVNRGWLSAGSFSGGRSGRVEVPAVSNHKAFTDHAEKIRHQTKQLLKRELPDELAEALNLDRVFEQIKGQPLSTLNEVLKTRLAARDASEAIKDHMADVRSIADAVGNSPGIPDTLFDTKILNDFIADKALDLAFHQKTRASASASYEAELTKITEAALYKAMVGRAGRDIALEANRINAIKTFIASLQLKGASATGDTSAALQTFKQATEIFGKEAVVSHAEWGMSQTQRRNAIANSVVSYVQYWTGSRDDASGLIKEMIKKPASGESVAGSGELTDDAKQQLKKLSGSLVQLVDPQSSVHRESQLEGVFKYLVEGSLVASGIDSHSLQRAREPGKQVQKPIVATGRPMAVKEAENPATNKGILNTITRIGLPVMRDDTAGRALKIQRTLQANIARDLFFDRNGVSLNQVNKMIEKSTSCAQLYQIGLLAAVAAGEHRLRTATGTALLTEIFALEKRAAVGAMEVDKSAIRLAIANMMDGSHPGSVDAVTQESLNSQVRNRGIYTSDGMTDANRKAVKLGFFETRKGLRKKLQKEIIGSDNSRMGVRPPANPQHAVQPDVNQNAYQNADIAGYKEELKEMKRQLDQALESFRQTRTPLVPQRGQSEIQPVQDAPFEE